MSARINLYTTLMFTMLLISTSLFSLGSYASEEIKYNLNLHLTPSPELPPILDNYASNDYMSSYGSETDLSIRSKGKYPLGLVRFKADKTMRVRGWEIHDNIYFGQAKIGKKWGVGLVVDRGSHYYGLNNRGISFLKKF